MASDGVRLLLVEGDEDDYSTLRTLVEGAGDAFELTWIASHELGLELLATGQHDLCLVDDRDGERDGVQFVRDAFALGVRAPIVVLAATDDENIDERAHEAGAADFLSKPGLDAGSLVRAIRHALARSRSSPAGRDLERARLRDPLTGLPGRGLLLDRLERAIARAGRRRDTLFCLLLVDIDRFATVNGAIGQRGGDGLLLEVARRLETCVRAGDTVARLGGDDFGVLLDEIADVADAVRVARRIQQELAMPFTLQGAELLTSASVGIAVSATGYETPEELVRDAGAALYRAKTLGVGRFELADPALRPHALARLAIESELAVSVERHELELRFHPVVSISAGEIAGFEALVRWRHPTRGVLSPVQFIAQAERTGMIVPIGRWVLREAAAQLAAWQRAFPRPSAGDLSVSVNVSMRELLQHDLLDVVAATLEDTGIAPGSLRLEVSEAALGDVSSSIARAFEGLRSQGVRVAIDDFGAGRASLGDLFSLPFDAVKVDPSFVSGVNDDPSQLRAAVALGRSLCPEVVIEGVETDEHASRVRDAGCDLAQGYYFFDPLARESAEALVAARSTAEPAQGPVDTSGPSISDEIARLAERMSARLMLPR